MKLNKLILARLPLCLPPIASNPAAYATGIRTFAPIFLAFEQEWRDIISSPERAGLASGDTEGKESSNITGFLATLYEEKLERTARIQSDLATLASRLHSTQSYSGTPEERRSIEKQYNRTSQTISSSIRARPHVLLAYSWVMYMALFNGGRWMRQQMVNAGPSFWQVDTSASDQNYGVLSFWFFDLSTSDGEELKSTFKTCFEKIASRLTDPQRSDIISEANKLFKICIDLVSFLDRIMLPSTMAGSVSSQSTGAIEAVITPMPPSPSILAASTKATGLFSMPTKSLRKRKGPTISPETGPFSFFSLFAAGLFLLAIWILVSSPSGLDEILRSNPSILTKDW